MKRAHRINNLLEQLFEIDKELGGKAQQQTAKKKAQEFDDIRDTILETLKQIETMQAERDKKIKKFGVDHENILTSAKIRDEMEEVERELIQLQRTLLRYIKKPKKYPRELTENYATQLQKLKDGLRSLKSKEFGVSVEAEEQHAVEFKDLLAKGGGQDIHRYELTEAEKEAMVRWNQGDEYMDKQLDQVIDGVDRIKDRAQLIGEQETRLHKCLGAGALKTSRQSKPINKKSELTIKGIDQNLSQTKQILPGCNTHPRTARPNYCRSQHGNERGFVISKLFCQIVTQQYKKKPIHYYKQSRRIDFIMHKREKTKQQTLKKINIKFPIRQFLPITKGNLVTKVCSCQSV